MSADIYEKLQTGIQHQQNNDLLAAEAVYRQILEEYPEHPDALHLLGVLAYQIGDYEVAEDLINHAIESDHVIADYYNNLGEVLRATDRLDEAHDQYQKALDLDPEHENAALNIQKLEALKVEQQQTSQDSTQFLPEVRQSLPSYLLSLDDETASPGQTLIDLSLLAAHKASQIDLQTIAERFPDDTAKYINVWPGEHYRLLAALVDILKPANVIEIGTATGASALCMKAYLPDNGKITTYDIIPWNQYPGTGLLEADFGDQLEQKIVDLSDPAHSQAESPLLEQADIIFVDAAKDNIMEEKFCQLFDSLTFQKSPLIIFDDTRMMPMLKIWRTIKHPKLDLTSFGHWSGTGLVEWNKSE